MSVADPVPPPCLHHPAADVAVPTPGVVAGTCSECKGEVGGYVCAACAAVVPMIDLAGRMSGTGCRSCGRSPDGR